MTQTLVLYTKYYMLMNMRDEAVMHHITSIPQTKHPIDLLKKTKTETLCEQINKRWW